MGNGTSPGFRADLAKRVAEIRPAGEFSIDIDRLETFRHFTNFQIHTQHLPVLYQLDKDKDGRFSEKDFFAFAEFACMQNCPVAKLPDIVRAVSTIEFVDAISNDASGVAEWMIRLATTDGVSGMQVSRNTFCTLYKLMNGGDEAGRDLIWEGLRSVGNCPEQPTVPRPVVSKFIRKYLTVYAEMLSRARGKN
jgi:hypothetical protein